MFSLCTWGWKQKEATGLEQGTQLRHDLRNEKKNILWRLAVLCFFPFGVLVKPCLQSAPRCLA